LRLGLLPPLPSDMMERAVALAAKSDVALVFAGLSSEWESEGFDRADLELPGNQNELIARVAEANPNTVVVLNAGSAVTMPWLDKVAAVLQAWYPGQEAGNAIADVLFGDVNPSGKLPQTFPVRLEDNPTYLNFPGENGKVLYGERLFVGYRYYDKKRVAPLFPFGFGLSYTTFEYGDLELSATRIGPDETLEVSITVTNTGSRGGKEVVQVYVRDVEAHLQRPEKELKAFAKVALEPRERKTVTLVLTRESLAYFDDRSREWVVEAGTFEVLVGASSQDIRAVARFEMAETARWLV
jgi:beta-glucosidase